MLEEAYHYQLMLDHELDELADKVFKELMKELKKLDKIDLDTKIRLIDHPDLYQAVQELERKEFERFTYWSWVGFNVMTESLTNTYRNTLLTTYDMFRPSIPSAPGPQSLNV
jgi:hypothetical protein